MKGLFFALIALIAVICSSAPPGYADAKDNVFEQVVYTDVANDVAYDQAAFILSHVPDMPLNNEGESPGVYLFRDIELTDVNFSCPVAELQTFSNPCNIEDIDAKQLAGYKVNTFPVTIRKL